MYQTATLHCVKTEILFHLTILEKRIIISETANLLFCGFAKTTPMTRFQVYPDITSLHQLSVP